ncbi:MAG: molybdopterin molybdotransferase MoeA [Deltaproteobacteria bacterium]|jgi:molybdopterin molybdotransferase|nr:molybdopterin molybdotransferase MoeA [Deltaproteobacteria bacterium]
MTNQVIDVPQMILVGSAGRNSGKTHFSCAFVALLKEFGPVVGLKVTAADAHERGCRRGGAGCGACVFSEDFVLQEETDARSNKDTSRLLAAGAERVFWLRATYDSLSDGLKAFLAHPAVPSGSIVVAESNSLRRAAKPGFFLMLKNPQDAVKASAAKVAALADLTLESRKVWQGERVRNRAEEIVKSSPVQALLKGLGHAPAAKKEADAAFRDVVRNAALEEALALLLTETEPTEATTVLPINDAHGEICAGLVKTAMDIPPFDRSPLDGFALRSADVAAAGPEAPTRLTVVGVVYAGDVYSGELGEGEAVRIMTGGAMPSGADAMLPLEVVRAEGDAVFVSRSVKPRENYVFRGEDVKAGTVFLEDGAYLDYAAVAMLASAGLAVAPVYRPLSVGLFCVGDEFGLPGQPLPPGKIYNSNGFMLSARLREFGFKVDSHQVLRDDVMSSAMTLDAALERFDVVLTTGSVSVGDKDIMKPVYAQIGVQARLAALSFKPGHAFLCGRRRNKWIFSLSGNPFASLAALELVVRPVLARMSRKPFLVPKRVPVRLLSVFPGGKSANMRRFLRGSLSGPDADGVMTASLPEGHSSGRVFSMAGCNCLVDLRPDVPSLSQGAEAEAVDLRVRLGF